MVARIDRGIDLTGADDFVVLRLDDEVGLSRAGGPTIKIVWIGAVGLHGFDPYLGGLLAGVGLAGEDDFVIFRLEIEAKLAGACGLEFVIRVHREEITGTWHHDHWEPGRKDSFVSGPVLRNHIGLGGGGGIG